ncbi:MAG: sigma-70 family RNA polymerase sigma factor [Myxococcales bacterium]|nr:sigma-70 family RNA polymerase sigma factor [Myxococcales bacterium]
MNLRARRDEDPTVMTLDYNAKLEALFSSTEARLTNVLFRYLWNRQDVEDTIQDAFVRLWRMQSKIDWERAEALIFRIAINAACSKLRKRKLWSLVPSADETSQAATPEVEIEMAEANDMLRKAVDALPEKLRSVILLCQFSELQYDAVSDILGIPEGTVASRRNQAITRLRATLSERELA